MQDVQDREVVTKLFDTLAPRFEARPGGYTRLLRLGYRKGDSAEIAQVELVGSEFNPRAKAEAEAAKAEAAPKPKGVGGRLRAAAERLRGGKKDETGDAAQDQGVQAGEGGHAQVDDPTQGRRQLSRRQAGSGASGFRLWACRIVTTKKPCRCIAPQGFFRSALFLVTGGDRRPCSAAAIGQSAIRG